MTVRGLRNQNPGNIKRDGTAWEGMAEDQSSDLVFCVFRAPWWGIRAIAKIMLSYQRRHELRTVDQIIHRWAPPDPGGDRNPTTRYVTFIAKHMGVGRNEVINVEDFEQMHPLVQSICWFENGLNILTDPYTWEYQTGLILAGVEPTLDYLTLP